MDAARRVSDDISLRARLVSLRFRFYAVRSRVRAVVERDGKHRGTTVRTRRGFQQQRLRREYFRLEQRDWLEVNSSEVRGLLRNIPQLPISTFDQIAFILLLV